MVTLLVFTTPAEAGWSVVNLSNDNLRNQSDVDINDNDWVVWVGTDPVGHDKDIYLKKPGEAPVNLSNNSVDDKHPSINDQGWVAWAGHDGNDYEIYLKKQGSAVVNLSNNSVNDESPQIGVPFFGDTVYWLSEDASDIWHVYGKEGWCASPRKLSTNALNEQQLQATPSGYVVWAGKTAGTLENYEIYRYSPSLGVCTANSGIVNVSNNPGSDDRHPQVNDSGQVVWYGTAPDTSFDEIYFYGDIAGKKRITNDHVDDQHPRINNGGWFVWRHGLGYGSESVRMGKHDSSSFTISGNSTSIFAPHMSINNLGQVVWSGRPASSSGGEWLIYKYDFGSTAKKVTTYDTLALNPKINSNGRVVWYESTSDDEVYMYTVTRDYHFTWYDDLGGGNWVLMADPKSSGKNMGFNLSIGGNPMDLSGYIGGYIAPGQSITPRFGLMGGPVKVTSTTGDKAIVSQRTLWPKGGSSIEEVLGVEEKRLSDHFWWSWYDQQSPGYKNWVLVSNPNSSSVYYEIKIANVLKASGTIAPGENANRHFPGEKGGPVEVRAWTDSGKSTTANVMASQRVLSNGDRAFNEQVGIPDSELSDHYVWTWYDNIGGINWVLVSNPPTAAGSVNYEIKLDGVLKASGTLSPGQIATPTLPGEKGGPLEVTASGRVIASQRVVWGPSFGETPGYPYDDMASNYHWTWYDQQSPGMQNWVLLTNLHASASASYEVRVAGSVKASGTLAPGEQHIPTFPGTIGGPVEVTTSGGTVIASQRVLYNGYFNEVLGTVLD